MAKTLMPEKGGIRKFGGVGTSCVGGIRSEDGVEVEGRCGRVRSVGVRFGSREP